MVGVLHDVEAQRRGGLLPNIALHKKNATLGPCRGHFPFELISNLYEKYRFSKSKVPGFKRNLSKKRSHEISSLNDGFVVRPFACLRTTGDREWQAPQSRVE